MIWATLSNVLCYLKLSDFSVLKVHSETDTEISYPKCSGPVYNYSLVSFGLIVNKAQVMDSFRALTFSHLLSAPIFELSNH